MLRKHSISHLLRLVAGSSRLQGGKKRRKKKSHERYPFPLFPDMVQFLSSTSELLPWMGLRSEIPLICVPACALHALLVLPVQITLGVLVRAPRLLIRRWHGLPEARVSRAIILNTSYTKIDECENPSQCSQSFPPFVPCSATNLVRSAEPEGPCSHASIDPRTGDRGMIPDAEEDASLLTCQALHGNP